MTTALLHKHGGEITAVTAIEHSTDRGIAFWEFRGRVVWSDGSVSESAHISPVCLCSDDSEESKQRVRDLTRQLCEYLETAGTWHEMKYKRDGRAYAWTPHKPTGRQEVTP